MTSISLLAFLFGNLCDILLVIAGSFALTAYTHAAVHHPGMSSHAVAAAAIAMRSHGDLRVLSYVIGVVAALIAGIVGGRFGRPHAFLNGTLSNTLCFCLGFLILLNHASRDPSSLQFGLLVLGVLAAAGGGWIARQTTSRKPLQSSL